MEVRERIIQENLEKIRDLKRANRAHMEALVKEHGVCPLCNNPHYPHCKED